MTWTESETPRRLLLRDVEVGGRRLDVRVREGVVADVSPGLRPGSGEEVVEGRGGALVPGLHDHHLHLRALAAARTSVTLGPPEVRDAEGLRAALASAESRDGWVRGVGYHETVAGDLDRRRLDEIRGDVPVRVQHATGIHWLLNSAAVMRLGLDSASHPGIERDGVGRPTGRLERADAWLRERLGSAPPPLTDVSRQLASLGIVGVTDATAHNGQEDLDGFDAARHRGELLQDVLVMGRPGLAAGPATGAVKVVLDEHDLPDLEALVETVRRAHGEGRGVAIHAVTRTALVLAVVALRTAEVRPGDRVEQRRRRPRDRIEQRRRRPRDRIEHASICPPDLAQQLAALGVTVVTQPNLVAERGDRYLDEVDVDDRPWLYPCGLLDRCGVPLAAGSDAPYGSPDPWSSIRGAVERRTAGDRTLGPEHALDAPRALSLFLAPLEDPGGMPREVARGAPARLCLLRAPLAGVLAAPSADAVRMTVLELRALLRGA